MSVEPAEQLSVAGDTSSTEVFGAPTDFPMTSEVMVPSGAKARARANIAALELVEVLREARRPATLAEQRVLAAWSGWGAIPAVFDIRDESFTRERGRLRELLTPSQYQAAEASILNAHYTDPALATVIWDAVRSAGFSGGRVLEPGCGSGTFIGLAPDSAVMVGVDNDPVTAAIAAALYPSAQVRNEGFESTRVPENSFAATVGNVPFGQFAVHDPAHNPNRHSIHNHFILKALALTAPGGYVAVLTSRFTLDAADARARTEMADLADLVGAVRLPTSAFSRVAGTQVVTDLLILRRREVNAPPQRDRQWLSTNDIELVDPSTGDSHAIGVNDYYRQHPDHVLGALRAGRGVHGSTTLNVAGASGQELAEQLRDRLDAIVTQARDNGLALTASAQSLTVVDEAQFDAGLITAADMGEETPLYSLRYNPRTGGIEYWDDPQWLPNNTPRTLVAETRALIGLRDTARSLIISQRDGRPAAERDQLRGHLNHLYDSYVAAYGPVNRFTWVHPREPDQATHDKKVAALEQRWRVTEGKPGPPYRGPVPTELAARWDHEAWEAAASYKKRRHLEGGMRTDPGWAIVSALETFDELTGQARKAAIFSTDLLTARPEQLAADTAQEALAISLDRSQRVDLPLIARLLDVDEDQARSMLDGLVYPSLDDPSELIPATTALSGNVREKLAAAEAAADGDDVYAPYAAALRAVMPRDRQASEIRVRPGAAWIPADIVAQFIVETFGVDRDDLIVEHLPGRWVLELPKWRRGGSLMNETWGMRREGADAVSLLEAACNSRSVVLRDDEGQLDTQATFAAQAKEKKISEEFGRWVFADEARAIPLVAEFNRRFNSLRAPQYDGTHLRLPGLSNHFTPHPYQRNAIARILAEPTTLLDHVVGAGKSGVMFCAAMELKRLGLVRQPWLVVPNSILDQVGREAKQWYPAANILLGTAATDPEGRRRLVAQSASSDWDMVIIAQSAFTNIGVGQQVQAEHIEDQLAQLRFQLETAEAGRSKKAIERAIKASRERLERLSDQSNKERGLRFSDSGADYLMIDEAHLYKNKQRLCGIEELNCSTASQRAEDLFLKLSILRQRRQDEGRAAGIAPHRVVERVATFATGTPISNSLGELWVMQTFLRPDLLEASGVADLGDWGATFTKTHSSIELNATGTKLRTVNRVGKFTNLPGLLSLTNIYTDVVLREQVPVKLPKIAGGKRQVITLTPSVEVADFIADLGWRADHLDNRRLDRDNILKIGSDGRNASLDPRLAGLVAAEYSRASRLADDIMEIHIPLADRQYRDPDTGLLLPTPGALQLAVCDRGTPSKDPWQFTVYQAIKDELIARGMPAEKIRFAHEARKPSELATLRRQCVTGEVWVLIGSTEKVGVGWNIQARMAGLHHVDGPWRPSDVEQREGRIIRQGNQNDEVFIRTYVTEGTFDTVTWQKVEAKALFVHQMRRNEVVDIEIEDLSGGDVGAAAAETKAIATGDPRYVRQVELDDAVKRLVALERAHREAVRSRDYLVNSLEKSIPHQQKQLDEMTPAAQAALRLGDAPPSILVAEKHFVERSDTAVAVARACDRTFHAARDSGIGTASPTGITVGGIDVVATRYHADGLLRLRLSVASESKDVERAELAAMMAEGPDGGPKSRGLLKKVENLYMSLPRHQQHLQRRLERDRDQLDDLYANRPGPFDQAEELAAKEAELASVALELKLAANSPEAQAKAAAAAERMQRLGREPGWTLLLNPTPAIVRESGFRTAAEMRAAVRAAEEAAAAAYDELHGSGQGLDELTQLRLEYTLLEDAAHRSARTPLLTVTPGALSGPDLEATRIIARTPYTMHVVSGAEEHRRPVVLEVTSAAQRRDIPILWCAADLDVLDSAADLGVDAIGYTAENLPTAEHCAGALVVVPDADRWELARLRQLSETARQGHAKLLLAGDRHGSAATAHFEALCDELPWAQHVGPAPTGGHTRQGDGLLLDQRTVAARDKQAMGLDLDELDQLTLRLATKREELRHDRVQDFRQWQDSDRRHSQTRERLRERDQEGPDLSL